MPYTMCPLCGAKMHVNTGDPVAYEAMYPELRDVGFACRLCSQCDGELLPGDRILVRSGDGISKYGQIDRIAKCNGREDLFRVTFDNGTSSTFARAQIAKRIA